MSARHVIPLVVRIAGVPVASETTAMWAGPYLLAVATVLPDRDLVLDVHSSFLGHPGVPTLASHIVLGPLGTAPYFVTAEHDHASLDPSLRPRECVYEHANVLVEALKAVSEHVGVDVPDDAFAVLERPE